MSRGNFIFFKKDFFPPKTLNRRLLLAGPSLPRGEFVNFASVDSTVDLSYNGGAREARGGRRPSVRPSRGAIRPKSPMRPFARAMLRSHPTVQGKKGRDSHPIPCYNRGAVTKKRMRTNFLKKISKNTKPKAAFCDYIGVRTIQPKSNLSSTNALLILLR